MEIVQYYYHNTRCNVENNEDPKCICWHNVGSGPFPYNTPEAPYIPLSLESDIDFIGKRAKLEFRTLVVVKESESIKKEQ